MSLLRICLVVAILAGLGAGVVSQFKVATKIAEIERERDDNAAARDTATKEASDAKTAARKAKEEQEKALKDLTEANAALETTTAKATEQEKRANTLQADLTKTLQERNRAQQELSAWNALGIPVDQIKTRLAEIKTVREERDTFVEENKILQRKNNTLSAELAKYVGDDLEVKMTPGLKGKVLTVNPQYDFVVLDIGEKQGAVPLGKLMVNRGGKLVAKVQLIRVEPDRSVANVLADWKQADVAEGDQVIY